MKAIFLTGPGVLFRHDDPLINEMSRARMLTTIPTEPEIARRCLRSAVMSLNNMLGEFASERVVVFLIGQPFRVCVSWRMIFKLAGVLRCSVHSFPVAGSLEGHHEQAVGLALAANVSITEFVVLESERRSWPDLDAHVDHVCFVQNDCGLNQRIVADAIRILHGQTASPHRMVAADSD